MSEPLQPKWPSHINGIKIRLEPLSVRHADGLRKSCAQPGCWEKVWMHLMDGHLFRDGGIDLVMSTFFERKGALTDYPFAIVLPGEAGADDAVVGIIRYLEIDWQNHCIEIGTLIGQDYQGTGVNLDSKLAVLSYAFEVLTVERVQFKVDERNERSLKAVEGLGAQREGVLRRHILMADGSFRSSVIYSILRSDWAELKGKIVEDLKGYGFV
jgi:N-acetyltransferase